MSINNYFKQNIIAYFLIIIALSYTLFNHFNTSHLINNIIFETIILSTIIIIIIANIQKNNTINNNLYYNNNSYIIK